MKNDIKLKTALALGLVGLLTKKENPLQKGKDHYLAPMSQEDKYRAQGLKAFHFPDGVVVWSINQKNATKKIY